MPSFINDLTEILENLNSFGYADDFKAFLPMLSTPSRGVKCRLQSHAVIKRRQQTHTGRPRNGQPRKQLKGGSRHRTAQRSVQLRTVETKPGPMRGKERGNREERGREKRKRERRKKNVKEDIQGVPIEGDHHCDMEPAENANEAEQPTKIRDVTWCSYRRSPPTNQELSGLAKGKEAL